MHLVCLRPFFWFGLPNRGPREPYVETKTARGHTGHNLPVLLVAALPNPPNSPSSYLTGSVPTAAEPAAPAVLAICPLFHRHTSQRHVLANDLLQPWKYVETLFQGGLCDIPAPSNLCPLHNQTQPARIVGFGATAHRCVIRLAVFSAVPHPHRNLFY